MSSDVDETRDYSADLTAVIDAEMGPYDAAPLVAARIADKLAVTDHDLLSGWLWTHRVDFLRQHIGLLDRRARTAARRATRGEFARAVADGNVTPFLSLRFVVNEDHQRLQLRDMRRQDLLYVADSYERESKVQALEGAFFRALAKKVGNGTVADYYTEEQIVAMHRAITGPAA